MVGGGGVAVFEQCSFLLFFHQGAGEGEGERSVIITPKRME